VHVGVLKEWGLRFCSSRFGRLKAGVRLAYLGNVRYGAYCKVLLNGNLTGVSLKQFERVSEILYYKHLFATRFKIRMYCCFGGKVPFASWVSEYVYRASLKM